jgi:hypothetical protein
MRQLTSCADTLVLLGEMIEVASGYVDQCEEARPYEEPFMLNLAHDQIYYLRKRLSKLDERLCQLEVELRPKTSKR